MKCDTIAIPKAVLEELDAAAARTLRWTPQMDAILRQYAGRVPNTKLADVLTRNFCPMGRSAIANRIRLLGIKKPEG